MRSAEAKRLRLFCNALSLQGVRIARQEAGPCKLCNCTIQPGQEYRGPTTRRAHNDCFKATAGMLNEKDRKR